MGLNARRHGRTRRRDRLTAGRYERTSRTAAGACAERRFRGSDETSGGGRWRTEGGTDAARGGRRRRRGARCARPPCAARTPGSRCEEGRRGWRRDRSRRRCTARSARPARRRVPVRGRDGRARLPPARRPPRRARRRRGADTRACRTRPHPTRGGEASPPRGRTGVARRFGSRGSVLGRCRTSANVRVREPSRKRENPRSRPRIFLISGCGRGVPRPPHPATGREAHPPTHDRSRVAIRRLNEARPASSPRRERTSADQQR